MHLTRNFVLRFVLCVPKFTYCKMAIMTSLATSFSDSLPFRDTYQIQYADIPMCHITLHNDLLNSCTICHSNGVKYLKKKKNSTKILSCYIVILMKWSLQMQSIKRWEKFRFNDFLFTNCKRQAGSHQVSK